MYRWRECPGSVRLSEGIPNISSPYAEEGTKAHQCGEIFLKGGVFPKDASEEMLEAVQVYTDYFLKRKKDFTHWELEQRFNLEAIHPGLFGTSDATLYCENKKLLEVIDYKHGAGVPVDVFHNPQLKYYALGALLQIQKPCDEILMTIVQPRCFHPDGPIRSFSLSSMELLEFAGELVTYAKATEHPQAPLRSGDHCKFCPAAAICPELKSSADKALSKAFENVTCQVYDTQELAKALDLIPKLESWISGVHSFAYNEMVAGVEIPGYKLVQKVARRKWKDEDAAISALKDFGISDEKIFSKALLSPAQIEKALGKDIKPLVADLTSSESSGTTLVPDTDKRQKVDAKALPNAFANVITDIKPEEIL